MSGNRVLTALAVVIAALVTLGCEPKLYRAETVLHADGSVERAIYQGVEATTADAQKAGVWNGSTYAGRIEHERWSGSIADLPQADRDERHSYFAAWGKFESPQRMPQAFVRKAPQGLPDGKLIVDYQREDYGLVVEHRFKETLTDIVTIDDMHLARREMADLLIPLAPKILDEALGDKYDTSRLGDWLNQTATPWLFEISDVVFQSGVRRELSEDKLAAALAPVCARRGLVLTDASGKLLDSAAMEDAVETYAAKVLRDTLRRRDGEDVSDEDVARILEWIGLKERPANGDEPYRRYNEAVDKVIAEKFGGEEAFESALSPLLTRMLGLYAGELLGSPHDFHYTLQTPGPIVKTNGTLVSDRFVRWTFQGIDAYPFGYAMECESLAAQGELEKALLGRSVLTTREALVKYVDLVRSDPALRQALLTCAEQKNMAPFYQARDEAPAASAPEKAFDAMGKLLELPKDPAER
jgi:hypothetical protein